MFTQNIVLNIVPGGALPVVHASKGDDGRSVECSLLNGDQSAVIDASTMSATVEGVTPSGATFTAPATLWAMGAMQVESKVTFSITAAMTAEAGRAACKVKITKGAEVVSTGKFVLDIEDLT